MFWRFGFTTGSSIDSLLDKDDVSLEAILDEDELLQECKAQNTRLIDYFQRVDVLQKLLAYVSGQIETDEEHFKYPHIATEVLCSEIWSIVETCLNEQNQLLVPFWESVLERSAEDMKTQVLMSSHWGKVNAVFLSKKPVEMLAFIKSQPNIVERILVHIECQPFVDLLVRIIQTDGQLGGVGILEWLSAQNLMGRLIDLLSPTQTPDVHLVAAELIKGIIAISTPSPGESVQNGPASNKFARELAQKERVARLVQYMLQDFGSPSPDSEQSDAFAAATSSVIQSTGVIIELIRKNNSDFFEPYLFHTLRNRLMEVQQQSQDQPDGGRQELETVMSDMAEDLGVVDLSAVLEIMCDNLERLVGFLKAPRSATGPVATTVGTVVPLTFERFCFCELIAELLHCSGMSLLNRPHEYDHLYDSDGRLQGGLAAMEDLAKVISLNNTDRQDLEDDERTMDSTPDFPVHTTIESSPSMVDYDDISEPGSSDDEVMEEITMHDDTNTIPFTNSPAQSLNASPNNNLNPILSIPGSALHLSDAAPAASPPVPNDTLLLPSSRRSSRRTGSMDSSVQNPSYIGERMKACLLRVNILTILLDLFYEFPWNNFLHSAIYDIIHQILTGNVKGGYNRELAISLFKDARLMYRIVEIQKLNDTETAKPKGVRLGYMGHLTLISEDIIQALERFSPDLRLIIRQYAPDPEWNEYVTGRYNETKERDTSLLGGGKPSVTRSEAGKWKVDEAETNTWSPTAHEETKPETGFTRSTTERPKRESSADFGLPADMDLTVNDDHDDTPHFTHYLEHELHGGGFGSDDEDDDSGWLSQSPFSFSNSSRFNTERKPLQSSGFDDAFVPGGSASHSASTSFDDDDGFGPFSDSAAINPHPSSFTSSFAAELGESGFDSEFGDFGDFQSANSGSPPDPSTPTMGSWTFTSGSSTASDDSNSHSPKMETDSQLGD